MNKKHASLGELALDLKINKSKLAYYFSLGLIKPVETVGRMNIFDTKDTLRAINDIKKLKKTGKKLKEIKVKK